MNEKRNCKIVQDLLPNYIEKLTNEETNSFIEEHLKECDKCQKVLENMKKDFQTNSIKQDNREVKYIKKYNSKLKLLRNILLIIVVLFVIITGRKIIILTKLNSAVKEFSNQTNYHSKMTILRNVHLLTIDSYRKDEKKMVVYLDIYNLQNKELEKRTMYFSEDENFEIIDKEGKKTLKKVSSFSSSIIQFADTNIINNIYIAIRYNVYKVDLDGKQCYMMKNKKAEQFVDANTGIVLKFIDNEENSTVDYEYEFGTVEDSDVARPDTTGYTLIE